MIRTQVQLTEDQFKQLRHASASTGRSVADLIREGVNQYLASRVELPREDQIERAVRIAGKFSSGRSDVSSTHDRHLAEAFRG